MRICSYISQTCQYWKDQSESDGQFYTYITAVAIGIITGISVGYFTNKYLFNHMFAKKPSLAKGVSVWWGIGAAVGTAFFICFCTCNNACRGCLECYEPRDERKALFGETEVVTYSSNV